MRRFLLLGSCGAERAPPSCWEEEEERAGISQSCVLRVWIGFGASSRREGAAETPRRPPRHNGSMFCAPLLARTGGSSLNATASPLQRLDVRRYGRLTSVASRAPSAAPKKRHPLGEGSRRRRCTGGTLEVRTKWIKPTGEDTGIQICNSLSRSKEPLILRNANVVTW